MERYLITQSLLSSWLYTFNCPEGYEEDAREEYLNALNRIPKEPNEAIQNGIMFEQECYREASGNRKEKNLDAYQWEPGIKAVADIIRGAPVQVKASRELECCGMTFLIYGILDALKAGTIYDVKFLNKSMGGAELAGKYLESPQHPAYFYIVPEATEFKYLVSDGKDLYIETYERSQVPHIRSYAEMFIGSLKTDGLLDLYKEKWLAL